MKHLISILVYFAISACSSLPHAVEVIPSNTTKSGREVFVVSHGWHTGLVVPAELIQAHLPDLNKRFKGIPYIEFGWGDKGFYQSKEITTGLTLRAIFWPTESIIHAVSVPMEVYKFFPNSQVRKICLTNDEYVSLVQYIKNSFYINKTGKIVRLKTGIYGDSQFYKSVGDYYLMNTCNKWTAKALKSGGMNINTTFKLTANSIMEYLENESKVSKTGNCI